MVGTAFITYKASGDFMFFGHYEIDNNNETRVATGFETMEFSAS
jgi:hypothetical protein